MGNHLALLMTLAKVPPIEEWEPKPTTIKVYPEESGTTFLQWNYDKIFVSGEVVREENPDDSFIIATNHNTREEIEEKLLDYKKILDKVNVWLSNPPTFVKSSVEIRITTINLIHYGMPNKQADTKLILDS